MARVCPTIKPRSNRSLGGIWGKDRAGKLIKAARGDRMKLRSKVLIVSLIANWTLLGISHAQELKRIRIGYPSLSFRQSNVWVAKEQGLFKKYGLEVEPIYLRGGQVATQALDRKSTRLNSSHQLISYAVFCLKK